MRRRGCVCPAEPCGACERAIEEAEYARDFPEVDDWAAEAAARDMVYGRGPW